MKTTRRQFIKWGAAAGVGALTVGGELLFVQTRSSASVTVPQTALDGSLIPQFQDPLPTFIGKRVSSTSFSVRMLEFQQKILPASIYSSLSAPYRNGTYVRGYQVDSRPPFYPGYTVEARRGSPTTVTYINNLPSPSNSHLEGLLTVDQTLHWADPLNQMGSTEPYNGSIPTVIHLHGAEVPSAFDGTPDQWFTADGRHGKAYETLKPTASNAAIYRYPNTQEATTLWFHDHALGMTRINVFAGLAAFYLVRDQFDTGRSDNPLRLPAGAQEIELLLQDKQFDTNGQLFFPDSPPTVPAVHPFWRAAFIGDVNVVNGKSWPYLEVEPRRYRFRFVNGANAREYALFLEDSADQTPGPPIWQIGTDGGLQDRPALLNDPNSASPLRLILGPAERADTIVDFTGLAGRNFTLRNVGPGATAATSGVVMQFRVNKPLSSTDRTYNPASGAPLRGGRNQPPAIVRLTNPETGTLADGVTVSAKRQLTLLTNATSLGIVEILLNNTKWSGLREGTTTPIDGSRVVGEQGIWVSELPRVGSTEIWEIVNLLGGDHLIHIHLIQFQILNRQAIDTASYRPVYNAAFPGGTYAGVTPEGTWGLADYPPGTFIGGYGPPQPYTTTNADGALGGNPAVGPYLVGDVIPPDPNEFGWKDVFRAKPNMVNRVAIRWAPLETPIDGVSPGQNLYAFDPTEGPGYVWHCHILDHEDNEMMRPYIPVP